MRKSKSILLRIGLGTNGSKLPKYNLQVYWGWLDIDRSIKSIMVQVSSGYLYLVLSPLAPDRHRFLRTRDEGNGKGSWHTAMDLTKYGIDYTANHDVIGEWVTPFMIRIPLERVRKVGAAA